MKFVIVNISILLSSLLLCASFDDYKKEKYLTASIEVVTAIGFITCVACVMWHTTSEVIV